MNNFPRLLFAAPASGSGKTTLVCGLLGALLERDLRPAAFKCGPDFIDPMFHREILGIPGYNLDLFFTSPDIVRGLFCKGAADAEISILEGVMGYYDGIGGGTMEASSCHLAQVTQTPTILVVPAGGTALSMAALVNGFVQFRENSMIKGLVINRCSEGFYQMMKPVLEKETGLPVYGYLPKITDIELASRHLGLVTPAEVEGLKLKNQQLAQQVEKTLDIEGLLQLAGQAPPISGRLPEIEPVREFKKVSIGVAKDSAFCFYYQENLELLEELGAEICFFSPLEDNKLPEGIQALYFGGGYPEIHAKELSENRSIILDIQQKVRSGMPVLAECGGFLYLQQQLESDTGQQYPMAGILEGAGFNAKKLGRFGYITLQARKDTLLTPVGGEIKAHEFHYWDSTCTGDAFRAIKPSGKGGWGCIMGEKNIFAGFPHLYFWSNTQFVENFVKAGAEYVVAAGN